MCQNRPFCYRRASQPSVVGTRSSSSERREQYLTYLLVSIVGVFLLCHSLKFFLVFYEELDECIQLAEDILGYKRYKI